MRSRPSFWILLCLLLLAGAWFFWPAGDRPAITSVAPQTAASPKKSAGTPDFATVRSASTAPLLFAAGNNATNAAAAVTKTNPFPYRLSNTQKSLNELMGDRKAILLENALVDTEQPTALPIPEHLRAEGDPGSYIVQARGPLNNAFRAKLKEAGATIVSYIPNNAYLVRASAQAAKQLETQARIVLPYEPYYKLSANAAAEPSLLELAVKQKSLPEKSVLNVLLFEGTREEASEDLAKLGSEVLSEEPSPFGQVWFGISDLDSVHCHELFDVGMVRFV